MIPTSTEPIINHLGAVDGVCPEDYPIAYAHLLLSCCFEPSTLFPYYNCQTTKRYCQFCFEKLDRDIQNNCAFFTSWHSICKLECIYMTVIKKNFPFLFYFFSIRCPEPYKSYLKLRLQIKVYTLTNRPLFYPHRTYI